MTPALVELVIKCSLRYPEISLYAAVVRLQAQDHFLLFGASEFQKGNLYLTRMSTNSRTYYYHNPIADQAAERRKMINFVGTAIFCGMWKRDRGECMSLMIKSSGHFHLETQN